MKQYYPSIGIEKFCRLFGKTRQAFYDHNRRDSDEQLHEALIIDCIRSIRSSIPGIGGLKLHMMIKEKLKLHHITIGRDRFFDLLREHGLLIKRRKRFVQTTYSNHPYRKWTNLIIDLKVTATEQLWVSDITYLRIDNSFVYLSLITDAYSRKIVGYHLSQQLKAKGCIIALKKAIASLSCSEDKRKLIHHSDRGIQYCCEPYVSILQENNISISMTQTGSPYDNAVAERINGILKHQLGLGKTFKNYNTAVDAVSKAIAAYNQLRPHMSISNLTPEKAHFTNQKISQTWKKRKSSVKLWKELN
ncbi:integrase core domain protein [mine drainage metagenome]|uniref:Integrase core domain protein n=1 Tax=mine drainage metagenome TaxID=410659 RepID=A0A1J5PJU1_9ZZZZ